MRKAREISCRFELDPQDCDWLLGSLGRFGAELTGETKDFALYVDTPETAIGSHGLALGIHRAGEITSDEVKSAVDSASRGLPPPDGWAQRIEPLSPATPVEARRWRWSLLDRCPVPETPTSLMLNCAATGGARPARRKSRPRMA